MTRSQIARLFSLAMSLPVDARFDITLPDEHGDIFITVNAPSMLVDKGKEPMWCIGPGGSCEILRGLASVPPPPGSPPEGASGV